MVRPLLRRRKRAKPQNHVDMRLGDGWHKRNFLSEVVIPSLFTRRQGHKIKPVFPELAPGKICITWIGHASFLIQTPEHSVLIDPNWAKWLKVIKRIKHPGIELRDLPAIDLVLVTHAHFDHLDRRTLRAIASDQPIAVPEHVGNLVHDLGFNRIHELRHWQSFEHGTLKLPSLPHAIGVHAFSTIATGDSEAFFSNTPAEQSSIAATPLTSMASGKSARARTSKSPSCPSEPMRRRRNVTFI